MAHREAKGCGIRENSGGVRDSLVQKGLEALPKPNDEISLRKTLSRGGAVGKERRCVQRDHCVQFDVVFHRPLLSPASSMSVDGPFMFVLEGAARGAEAAPARLRRDRNSAKMSRFPKVPPRLALYFLAVSGYSLNPTITVGSSLFGLSI